MGVVRCGSGARGVGHNANAGQARGRGGVRGAIVLQTGIGRGVGFAAYAAAAGVPAGGAAAAAAAVVVTQGAAAAAGGGAGNAATSGSGVRPNVTYASVASGHAPAPAPAAPAARVHLTAPVARPEHAAPAARVEPAAVAAPHPDHAARAPAVAQVGANGSLNGNATRSLPLWRQTLRRLRAETRSTSEPTLRHQASSEATNSRFPNDANPTQQRRPVGRPPSSRSSASASRSSSRGRRGGSRSSSRQVSGIGQGDEENQVFWMDRRWRATVDGHTVPDDRLRASVEELRATMMIYGKKWIFQLERGEESGTLHYQGYIQLKEKTRPRCWASSLHAQYHGISARPSSTNGRDALKNYVMKEDTRVDGPWCDPSMTVYTGEDLPRRESFYT